ncbi:MAG TPA: hypothetical protein PLG90_03675 [Ignavibacteria bacterium]|nr:hypothetical protein [Ignavibacteria bacterium]
MFKYFLICILFISCSKEEYKQPEIQNIFQNTETEEKKEIAEPIQITTNDASENIGNNVLLKGYIASVTEREKVAYLNFDKKYPNNKFTCVIFSKNFYKFDKLENYEKKIVEVTGKISVFNGKPQIILEDSEQIKILKN